VSLTQKASFIPQMSSMYHVPCYRLCMQCVSVCIWMSVLCVSVSLSHTVNDTRQWSKVYITLYRLRFVVVVVDVVVVVLYEKGKEIYEREKNIEDEDT